MMWSRQESNLYLKFRKLLFYPLNYGTIQINAANVIFLTFRQFKIHTMKKCLLLCIVMVTLLVQVMYAQTTQPPVFNHTTIFVTDLKRSADFYEKALQLPVIPEPFHDSKHVWLRAGEHSQIHVVLGAKEDGPHDINIHLAFSVPSVETFMKHLDDMNVKYGNWAQSQKTPQVRPDGVKQIYLQDPDGYWIEINDDKF